MTDFANPDLIKNLLPIEEVSILAGASGAGKSTILFQLLAAIVNGEESFLGHTLHHPIKVGYVAADRTWRSYQELARRVGLNLDGIQHRSLIDDATIDVFRLERDPMTLLKGLMESFTDVNLIIVDPMILFLGCSTNDYNKVAPRMIQLAKLCAKLKVTILGTHHASKARSDFSFQRAQDRINGSGALLGFSSTQLFLAAADELKQPYSELAIVHHNAPPETIKLVRGENGTFKPFEEQTTNTYFVRQVLHVAEKVPVTKKMIQKATCMASETLDETLDYMLREHLLTTNGRGEYKSYPVVEKES